MNLSNNEIVLSHYFIFKNFLLKNYLNVSKNSSQKDLKSKIDKVMFHNPVHLIFLMYVRRYRVSSSELTFLIRLRFLRLNVNNILFHIYFFNFLILQYFYIILSLFHQNLKNCNE